MRIEAYRKASDNAVLTAIKQTASAIEKTAKLRLHGMMGSAKHWITGILAKSIKPRATGKKGEYIVGAFNCEYAPYIEFGTGDLVFTNFDFDAEARTVASEFKGAGIRKVNIRGDSFLNYAAVEQQPLLVKRIEDELNKVNTNTWLK
jgi:hypothetical protein